MNNIIRVIFLQINLTAVCLGENITAWNVFGQFRYFIIF